MQGTTTTLYYEMVATIIKAQLIAKSLGVKCAAGYLRKRGFDVHDAVNALARKPC